MSSSSTTLFCAAGSLAVGCACLLLNATRRAEAKPTVPECSAKVSSELISLAGKAKANSACKCSKYQVGAALEATDGKTGEKKIFLGVNYESDSYVSFKLDS